MFRKIMSGHVAIQILHTLRNPASTPHMHPLTLRHIHVSAAYYQQSFYPVTVVLWNALTSGIVLRADLDSFKEGVFKINHRSP